MPAIVRVGLVQSVEGKTSEKGGFPREEGIQPQDRADVGFGSRRRLVSQSLTVTLSLLLPWPDLLSLRALAPRVRRAGARLGVGSPISISAGAGRAGSRALRSRGLTCVTPGQVSSARGPATPQRACP